MFQTDLFNASKYKTLDEVLAAIRGMDADPLANAGTNIVISRGNPNARLLMIGEAAPLIAHAVQGYDAMDRAGTLREAIERAAAGATAGEVVLMSPACASFDMFADYQDRAASLKPWCNPYRRKAD